VYSFLNGDFKLNKFEKVSKTAYFVDKTKHIENLSRFIGLHSSLCFIGIVLPSKFEKSVNCNMIASYYSKGANSKNLFDNFEISKCNSYTKHLNKHNVVFIDFSTFKTNNFKEYDNYFKDTLKSDLFNYLEKEKK